MTLTTLDPKTALVVIDLQKGIVSRPLAHRIDGVLRNAAQLADAFRRHGLPVVLVNVAGLPPGRNEQSSGGERPADWTELVPELARQPGDHPVTKHAWGAFTGTDLDRLLKAHGVTQVVVCGVSTSIGVETTAREAYALGYHVTLALDAMTDTSAEAHENSVTRIFPRLGESGTTADVLAHLDRRSGDAA